VTDMATLDDAIKHAEKVQARLDEALATIEARDVENQCLRQLNQQLYAQIQMHMIDRGYDLDSFVTIN